MTAQREGRGEAWSQFYPVEAILLKDFPADEKDAVLLFDIGGIVGKGFWAFKVHFPELPGRLVLQGLPAVINSITDIPSGIEPSEYNYFDPQPIRNAYVYYMRTVLHD